MNEAKELLNQMPEGELDSVICVLLWLNFKSGQLAPKEAVLNIFKIICGVFLYTHFQLTKGK